MNNFIEIKNLVKKYKLNNGKELNAVDNVNLNVEKGDIYGIMGLSGAGKSTLIRLINRLEEPTAGEILVKFQEKKQEKFKNILLFDEIELREFRKKTGMIFQHFNLLNSRNVEKNVAFPLEISGWKQEDIDKRVDELLEIVGLSDKKKNYPEQLSGGQKQRVAIARALANNPEILLSDEATSALDPRTTNSILELLKDINKKFGITIILITHQMEVIRKICNKAAIMSNGQIVEEGSTKEIFLHPKTELAKEFVLNISHDELEFNEKGLKTVENGIENLDKKFVYTDENEFKRYRLKFTGEQVEKAYMYEIITKFNTKVNVLGGSIDKLSDITIGHLIIEIEKNQSDNVVKWLEENKVEVEVL